MKVSFLDKDASLQLNGSNLFNDTKPLDVQRFPPERPDQGTASLLARYILIPPRAWRLTANFEF